MDQKTRSIVFKVVLDVVCLVLVAFPILIFYTSGKPFERGFYCDDESLRYPFKDSTVPSWVLYIFGLGLPIAAIVVIEFLLGRNVDDESPLSILQHTIPGWLQEAYKHIGVFGFGAVVSQLTTDIAKYSIGRLRPHFFDVCNPSVECSQPGIYGKYITRFACLNQNEKLVKDARLSFPSGHSSFSMYCMVFLMMYLHAKLHWRGSKLLKHVLQFFAFTLAFATALSRISDYKHHWSDVLCGIILGVTVAVLVVVFVSDLFTSRPQTEPFAAETLESVADEPVKPEQTNGQQNSVI